MITIIEFTKIKANRKRVFDASRSIEVHLLSAKETNEKAIEGKTSGLIQLGETVTWRAKHLGVYQNFTSRIIGCKPNEYFADEMVSGAFKSFKHEHFYSEENGITTLVDVLSYETPFGFLGKIVDAFYLKNYMRNFLLKRNATIKQVTETELWKSLLK